MPTEEEREAWWWKGAEAPHVENVIDRTLSVEWCENEVVATVLGPDGEPLIELFDRDPVGFAYANRDVRLGR